MDSTTLKATKYFVRQYSDQAFQCFESRRKKIMKLFESKSCPDVPWKDEEIEVFLHEIAMMDSNNFIGSCGVGEREARFASQIVARRHYYMGHGIGRSGDITEIQPKAAGSSLIGQLSNCMILDLLKSIGLPSLKKCIIVPLATGMSILLCLRTLHSSRPEAKYVIWPRLDQKSCFKCILASGLVPRIVKNVDTGKGLVGCVEDIEKEIESLGPDNIVCVLSTVSSFAPKVPDDVVNIAQLCKKYNVPHIVNNAYGIQSPSYLESIEKASKSRVDLFVSSTDKNFMVPVGGSIICGFEAKIVDEVGKMYPGRGSANPSMDMFITLLNIGKKGFLELLDERKKMFIYLKNELEKVSQEFGGEVLETPGNQLSLAFVFSQFGSLHHKFFTEIGSMLFSKFVMGARIVAPGDSKTIGGYTFKNWGSHTDESFIGYLTASATVGVKKEDIDSFVKQFKTVLLKVSKHINQKFVCEVFKTK
ncbi:o-phosphoseryl-tRNA(Sec) selenium transferase [Trichonephila inaurata madagascariensis]|uniref:O-phosphoseryl-tRNA(Sec) selenium transferase n=1 Tax=Trichonephila inaurata madagascariensis TaxID=2747483 RepID=A0A8X7BUS0_9ARAC|nr:o-phosphoseryl-tRNA(Sec) selenium transferase [Trichonephila inaurata madagascariensis]